MPSAGGVCDLEIAARPLAAVGQFGARRLQLHEHVMRGAKQQVALLGEDEAARMAMEQRDRELLLQRADLARNRRLRQAKLLAGMREAARFRRRVKYFQLVPVHIGKSVASSSHDYSAAARSLARKCEKTFGFKGRHAAKAGGRDRLPVGFVGDVAGGEHAGHRGRGRIRRHLDIAGWFQLDLAENELGRRRMADRDEDAVGRQFGQRAGLDVLQPDMGDLARIFGAADFVDRAVPDHLDLGVLEQAILQDALGAEMVAAMHDRHLRGEVGQEQRFLDRGIAAADHHDFLAAIEKSVAGGAGRYAETLELFFRRHAEPARLRAGGEDDRLGEIDVAAVAGQAERPLRQFELGDEIGDDFGADMGGLLLHLLHQPGALDHVGKARIVFHVGGDGELAAGLDALDQDRLQHRARRIDRGGVTGRAGTDDDDLGMDGGRHRQIPFLREFGQGLSGKRPERHRGGAESVKSKFKTSGELCKNCNPYRRIFPASEVNGAPHAQ